MKNKQLNHAELIQKVQRNLTDDLLSPTWQRLRDTTLFSGHCYIAAEALWHLIGGRRSNYQPCVLTHALWPQGLDPGETHWFLRNGDSILDPTAVQFKEPIAYTRARACGFLTKKPCRRAQLLIRRVEYDR